MRIDSQDRLVDYSALCLTGTCHLRCSYCYAGTGRTGTMAHDTARGARGFPAEAGSGRCTVTFSGGGPFMTFDILRDEASCAISSHRSWIEPLGPIAMEGDYEGCAGEGSPQLHRTAEVHGDHLTTTGRPSAAPWFCGRRAVAALACLLALPGASAAQDTGSWLCLQERPAPECRGFLRIEARGGTSLVEPEAYQYRGTVGPGGVFTPRDSIPWTHVGDWGGVEVGYAANLNHRWALGGSVAFDRGNETERILVRAQVRRWLTPRLYADALTGLLRQERDLLYRSGDRAVNTPGLSSELRVGAAGYGFVLARFDLLRAQEVMVDISESPQVVYIPGGTAHAFSVGGGLEGRTALVAAAITAVGMALVGIVVGWPGA